MLFGKQKCLHLTVLCNLSIYFIFSLFYFHFSWHFYFQKYLFRFGKDQSWEGQKLSVWQLEILATEYTVLLYLLLKLKPTLNIFSCGSAVWKSFEFWLSVVTWLRIFYLHRSFMRTTEHQLMFGCNKEDVKQSTDNTVWQIAEIFYITIRNKREFLIFWIIPGSKLI